MSSTPSSSKRVLIILMGSLGDVVRGLYLVDALRAAWSNVHITWLVEPACVGITRLHPRIDDIIVFERSRGLRGVLELRRILREREFDITLDLQRHLKSGFFSWFSGASRRVGFHRTDSKEGNWLFNTEYVPARGETIPKVEHYLSFLGALGLPMPEKITSGLEHITLASIDAPWVSQLEGGYIALTLGSSWDSKDWPEEGYAELLRLLAGETVVLISDRSKIEMSERLSRIETSARIVDLAGKTSLLELVAILAGARVCAGPDSGPAHIAGAVGTPHVTFFGPTPSIRNAPRGSESLVVAAETGCSPCKQRVCPGLGKVCMRLIHPQVVVQRIAEAQRRF